MWGVGRSIYDHTDAFVADEFVERLGHHLQDGSCPPVVNQLGRTLPRWKAQIVDWHRTHATNASTEALNNLIKRVKRVGSASSASATTGSAPYATPASRVA